MSNGMDIVIVKGFDPPAKPGVHHRLMCMTGENKGEAYYMKKSRLIMGRGEEADIYVADKNVSRDHAEIAVAGKRCVVTDLGSHNGVIVNDVAITQYELKDGDKVILGKTVYKYNYFFNDNDEDTEDEDYGKPKDYKSTKKLVLLVVGAVLMTIMFLDSGDEEVKKKEKSVKVRSEITNATTEFQKSLRRKKHKIEKEEQANLDAMILKGVREFREGNYSRAMSEFSLAQKMGDDGTAELYISRTRQALEREINKLKTKAQRDMDSLKEASAVVSYCNILALLEGVVDYDPTIKEEVLDNLKIVEKKMGLVEGELECGMDVNRGSGFGNMED